MSETSNVVRGVLHPDGTLELAERPSLPPGQVEVTIRPVVEKPRESLIEYLIRTRAELEASGAVFRTKEEIDADLEETRDWDRGEDRGEMTRATSEGYGPYLDRIRARREADGFPFRSKAEIDAEIEELRSWEDRPEGGTREDDEGNPEPHHR